MIESIRSDVNSNSLIMFCAETSILNAAAVNIDATQDLQIGLTRCILISTQTRVWFRHLIPRAMTKNDNAYCWTGVPGKFLLSDEENISKIRILIFTSTPSVEESFRLNVGCILRLSKQQLQNRNFFG